MGTLFREAIYILVIVGCVFSYSIPNESTNQLTKNDKTIPYCPRDCICKTTETPVLQSVKIVAKCNRLEVGTQKFSNSTFDLIIENSHDVKLTDSIFTKLGLYNVENVKIKNSSVTKVSPTAFANIFRLFSLDLSNNKIESLDPDTFSSNKDLYLLKLSGNPLTLTDSHFLNAVSLQELDLSYCGIPSISKKVFRGLLNINMINLSGNKLTEIDPEMFAYLDSLEEIDLSNNNLKTIPLDLFKDSSLLSSLSLSNNPLTSIDGLIVPELATFSLKNTKITTIKESTFDEMPLVENLLLSGNEISSVDEDAFSKLDLSHLDLSNNKLSYISDKIIKDNYNLDVLKIANNTNLKSLPKDGFVYGGETLSIYLFDASGCSLEIVPNNTFQNMTTLTQINLANNKITSLGSSLSYVKDLTSLDISNNNIEILEKYTFSKNKNLRILRLNGNPLVSISVNLFVSNQALSWLDISNCKLFKLWDNTDTAPANVFNKLSFLNASNNAIISIHKDETQLMKKLVTFDITSNPLKCNEEFQKLVIWLGNKKVSPVAKEIMANLDKDAKIIDEKASWEFLSKKVCNTKIDSEFSKADEVVIKEIESSTDEDLEDYYYDDKNYDNNDTSSEVEDSFIYEKLSDGIVEQGKELLATTREEVKIEKINENILTEVKIEEFKNIDDDYEEDMEKDVNVDGVKILKVVEDGVIEESISSYRSRFSLTNEDVSLILIFVGLLSVIVLGVAGLRRLYLRSSKNHLINTMRSRNDFIYRPLSEDLAGPRTPIFKKQMLISNILPETVPFQKDKNMPEAV